jgi:formate hydrogenlyase subunit 3/multisubunit Na+/H+ antiporter MnhD subunit
VLSYLILAPLAALVLLNLPVKAIRKDLAYGLVLLLTAAQVAVLVFRPDLLRSVAPGQFLGLSLAADELSFVLLLSVGIVIFVTALVGRAMMADEKQRFYFMNVLLVSLIGMNGAVLVTDLFSLYIFLEITAVASFLLIAFNRDRHGLEGAFKYIIMSAVATVLMLTAIALFLLATHGTSFDVIHKALSAPSVNPLVRIALAAFICGLFIKGGLVPFHGWVVGAYSAAPAPASVLLAGAATKISGIYGLIKLGLAGAYSSAPQAAMVAKASWTANLFTGNASSVGLGDVMLLVGMVSIVVGAFAAMAQTDMKRLLAWSSISQVGYIVLALGCGTPLAIVGAAFHLFNHAIFKSLLFVNSAAVEQQLKTTDMERLGGLGGRMPFTATTSVVGLLSAAGVPPLSGFWSKLLIVLALWQAGHPIYAILAVLLSVVTLGYLLMMQRKVFFGKIREGLEHAREASLGLVLASVVLAGVTVGAGVLFPLLYRTFLLQVRVAP